MRCSRKPPTWRATPSAVGAVRDGDGRPRRYRLPRDRPLHSPNYQRLLNICRLQRWKFRDEDGRLAQLEAIEHSTPWTTKRMETAQAIWSPSLARSFHIDGDAGHHQRQPGQPDARPLLPAEGMQEKAESDYETVYGSNTLQAMSAAVGLPRHQELRRDGRRGGRLHWQRCPRRPSGFGEEHEQADVVDQDDDAGTTDEQIAEDSRPSRVP